MTCSRHHSQYEYRASAFALAAEFERPKKHSLPPHASVVLAGHGGHGSSSHPGLKVDGLVSFNNAYSEVGGSYDECHKKHTTHAWSVLEGVNVADMLTADRVVSRIAIYYAADDSSQATFDITGSYFQNLRIAGYEIDVKLDTKLFHDNNTYSQLAQSHQNRADDSWLMGSGLIPQSDAKLTKLEGEYHALHGMKKMVEQWKDPAPRPADLGYYRLSAANKTNLNVFNGTEIEAYGGIICIPKFGVIRLGEMIVTKYSRTLTMFRVQMCSSGHGSSAGPTSSGGGGG